MNWTDCIKYGPPDEDGTYLCYFSDGLIETFQYTVGDTFWWTEEDPFGDGDRVLYWMYLPPGPEKGND